MQIAAVIPTTGQRLRELRWCLQSLSVQTYPLAEILIVDASNSPGLKELASECSEKCVTRVVRGTTRGLTAQRNIGVTMVDEGTDVVLFLDDDVELDMRYVEIIAGHFEADTGRELGGVAGVTTQATPEPSPLWLQAWHRLFVGRNNGEPRFTRGGVNLRPKTDADGPMEADWLFGCAAYRQEVLANHRFDEQVAGYYLLEDVDFSLSVGKSKRLLVDPSAHLIHHHGKGGRPNDYGYARAFVENRYRIVRRHRDSLITIFAFWWTTVGFLALWSLRGLVGRSAIGRREMRARAVGGLHGIRAVLTRPGQPSRKGGMRCDAPIISVAVLSVPGRDRELQRCLRAVENQTRSADEVVVVHGQTSVVSALQEAWDHTHGGWIALLDDDSIPQDDWIATLEQHLSDPTVGAVGGRILNFVDGRCSAQRYEDGPVAQLSWFGRTRDRLTGIPLQRTVCEADFLQGSNMCVRRDALTEIDPLLDVGMAPGVELALCQRIRSEGWRVIFDSGALVTHYPAPRPAAYDRNDRTRLSHEHSVVVTYALLTVLSWPRRLAFVAYFFLVGQKVSPGILLAPYFLLPGRDFARFRAAWSGKLDGLRRALRVSE